MYLVSLCKLEEHTLEVVDILADTPPEIQAGTLADIQAGVAGTLAADIQSGVVGTLGLVGRLMGLVLEEYFGLWLRTRVPGLYIPDQSYYQYGRDPVFYATAMVKTVLHVLCCR